MPLTEPYRLERVIEPDCGCDDFPEEPMPTSWMEPFEIEETESEEEDLSLDPEIKLWRERGVDVSIKPACK